MGDALGLIETQGLVACIEAADSMCKAANVVLIGYENVGSGLVTAMVKGMLARLKPPWIQVLNLPLGLAPS
ncbi:Propanediol utilization protein PduA [Providencia rustigianii]|nr:Propanediol utilization protein PduA [Providencia rustigianii]